MKLITITHCQIHVTLMTFSRSWIVSLRLQTTLLKNALLQQRQTTRHFAIDNQLVYVLCRNNWGRVMLFVLHLLLQGCSKMTCCVIC